MTRSVIRLSTTAEDHRIAQLAAAAIGLALIDAAGRALAGLLVEIDRLPAGTLHGA